MLLLLLLLPLLCCSCCCCCWRGYLWRGYLIETLAGCRCCWHTRQRDCRKRVLQSNSSYIAMMYFQFSNLSALHASRLSFRSLSLDTADTVRKGDTLARLFGSRHFHWKDLRACEAVAVNTVVKHSVRFARPAVVNSILHTLRVFVRSKCRPNKTHTECLPKIPRKTHTEAQLVRGGRMS